MANNNIITIITLPSMVVLATVAYGCSGSSSVSGDGAADAAAGPADVDGAIDSGGGDGSINDGSVDGAMEDGGGEAGPKLGHGTGRIYLVQDTNGSAVASASFSPPIVAGAPSLCTTVTDGACILSNCSPASLTDAGPQDAGTPPKPNAGAISFSGGSIPNGTAIVVTPAGFYAAKVGTSPWFNTGDTIAVAAAGGSPIGAFTQTITAAAAVTVTSPTLGATAVPVPLSTALTLVWTGGASGTSVLAQLVQQTAAGGSVTANCTFDSSGGSGTIPISTLGHFTAGDGNLNVTASAQSTFTQDDYDIALIVENGGEDPGVITFQP